MSKDQIVIVTQTDDAHADDMILKLAELGHEPVRLNTDDIPVNTGMSLTFSNTSTRWQGGIGIETNGRVIDVEHIRSIWWRRPGLFALPSELSEQERVFADMEIKHVLRGLWASLNCYWVSYPEHIRQASWKGEQLKRAAALGFEVPRTLITTEPEEARAFFELCNGQMIFKVLSDPFLGITKMTNTQAEQPPEPRKTMTTLMTEHELELLDAIRLVPCLFQEYVPKHLELRVTVIGNEVFAAEIHSQSHQQTSLDWRQWDVAIPYKKAALPQSLVDQCLALVRSYQLNFSAIDLILTPDGRYVFIENNPNGQFMFVEKFVPELRMTEALANCLVRGSNG